MFLESGGYDRAIKSSRRRMKDNGFKRYDINKRITHQCSSNDIWKLEVRNVAAVEDLHFNCVPW